VRRMCITGRGPHLHTVRDVHSVFALFAFVLLSLLLHSLSVLFVCSCWSLVYGLAPWACLNVNSHSR
jgi:hypothetical protein